MTITQIIGVIFVCFFVFVFLKNLEHIGDLFEINGKMRSWENLRAKLDLNDNRKFYCRQIIHTISRAWKETFLKPGNNINNSIINKLNPLIT